MSEEECGICGGTLDEHDNRIHRVFYQGVARERADIIAFAEGYAETGFEQERGIFDYFIKCLKSGEHYEEAQSE